MSDHRDSDTSNFDANNPPGIPDYLSLARGRAAPPSPAVESAAHRALHGADESPLIEPVDFSELIGTRLDNDFFAEMQSRQDEEMQSMAERFAEQEAEREAERAEDRRIAEAGLEAATRSVKIAQDSLATSREGNMWAKVAAIASIVTLAVTVAASIVIPIVTRGS